MADVSIRRTDFLRGEINAPPSKSYTHRMLIAAFLSKGKTKIEKPLVSDDTLATLGAIKAFGAKVKTHANFWEIEGQIPPKTPCKPVDCSESGATLRFMIPIAALAPSPTTFLMGPSLSRRPIMPLLQSLEKLGIKTYYRTEEPTRVRILGGRLKGGKTALRGDISSQFISGLLFACPLAQEKTEIALTTSIESKTYIQMTEEILNKHGVKVSISEDFRTLQVPGNQAYKPCSHTVPGDFSSTAYILAAAAITSSKIKIKNLNHNTRQGDKAILQVLKNAGLEVKVNKETVEVQGELSKAINIDAKDVPDLVPACSAMACYTRGTSKIYNAKRLRYKESDRLTAVCTELKKMGADIHLERDSLTIKGACTMRGATIDPHNDHRIAMMCAAVALGAEGETRIINAECVRKSYPTFFRDLHVLGANIVGG